MREMARQRANIAWQSLGEPAGEGASAGPWEGTSSRATAWPKRRPMFLREVLSLGVWTSAPPASALLQCIPHDGLLIAYRVTTADRGRAWGVTKEGERGKKPTEGRNGSHTGGSQWVVEGGATAASPARSSVRTSNSPAGMSLRALQMHTTGLCLGWPSGKCVSSLGGPLSINHSHTAEGGGLRIGRLGCACCTE